MAKKLKIWLPGDWGPLSNPDGPVTVVWKDPAATGALQISTAEYKGGKEPRPSQDELKQQAESFGTKRSWGEVKKSGSGTCVMGLFGTAAFLNPGDMDYWQVWFVSNGLDFVLITFIASKPKEQELAAAQRIVEGVNFI